MKKCLVLSKTATLLLASLLMNSALQAAEQNKNKWSNSGSGSSMCPGLGWQEGLKRYTQSGFPFPTDDTAHDTPQTPVSNCVFQQWSAEAFVWATTIGSSGVPRFMELQTPEALLQASSIKKSKKGKVTLKLAARSLHPLKSAGFTEGAGAIVEADGNMLVAPNGYPVYASVHMNPSYFNTAKMNLVVNGGYNKYANMPNDKNAYFQVGAAVFKATWLRLDNGESPPPGAYVTEAQVPVLQVLRTKNQYTVVPWPGLFQTVKVALVGLHVVGYTQNHPEFLWATFEHKSNAPAVTDNQFNTSGSDPNNYTFYSANTPYTQVDQANPPQQGQSYIPPQLNFNPGTQKFSPANNVVLMNKTGGASFGNNPSGDITAVSSSMQSFLSGLTTKQSTFANYNLIGTVWLEANSYVDSNPNVMNTSSSNAIGSVNLANSTAETFQQYPTNTNMNNVQNCFMCHNPTTISSELGSAKQFPNRRVSVSHVLEVGTNLAVPNLLTVPINNTLQKK